MIRGIGIDAVDIFEFGELLEGPDNFAVYAFSEKELAQTTPSTRTERLAGCFAAKEAVFKALAHLVPERTFDFRFIELLHNEDGSPYIAMNDFTARLLDAAGVEKVHVSLTNENDMAMAFVVAESSD